MSFYDVIASQNPWWLDPAGRPGTPERRRIAFEALRDGLIEPGRQRALILLGPRQVGKSTLLKQLACDFLDRGWPPANLLYFDFKNDSYDHTHSPREVLDVRPPSFRGDHPRLLLLDEVTHAPRWDVALKQMVDDTRAAPGDPLNRILATDSAAALIRQGATESLQGRIDEIKIHGLTFREALRIQASGNESEKEILFRSPGAMERFLARGGLPEHITSERPERAWERIRSDVSDRAIARDLSREGNIDVERVVALFRHLVQESGGVFEASNRARDLTLGGDKGPDARTIRRWVALLKHACLLDELTPWHPGLRRGVNKASRALKSRPKLYAGDHGFIPAFSPFSSPMSNGAVRARVHETVVFTQLRALREERGDFSLYYFREDDRAEIDFILDFGEHLLGLEVTTNKTPEKKLPGLKRACERAGIDRLILVHSAPTTTVEKEEFASWPIDAFLLDPGSCIDRSLQWLRKSR